MIHDLRTFGLALVAVFAVSAAGASTASAQTEGKLTAAGPVTLTAEQTGTLFSNSLTIPLGDLTCAGSTYTGHKYDTTPHELIPSGATTFTVTPKYTNCKAHIGLLGTRHGESDNERM